LFIATSAISTTGLVTVDVGNSYNFFGQLIILGLIQMGAIGYMTFSSFVILTRKKTLPSTVENVAKTVFSLPENFKINKFIYSVVIFTFIVELLGAITLYFIFSQHKLDNALWLAIFHSVSAFCTAGFSLFSNSFENFSNDFWLNFVISILSFSGAIGFIVFVDFWRTVKGKIKSITLTSQIIIKLSFTMLFVGTMFIFITEPSLKGLPNWERLLNSFFQTVTSITTVGFNTINIGSVSKSTTILITMGMIIGASPSGTGGGIKTTTMSAVFAQIKSSIFEKNEVTYKGIKIPEARVKTALSTFSLYLIVLFIGIYLLSLTEKNGFEDIFFEAASAIGTVGLSRGITESLSELGKLIIMLLMFIGRLGALSFGIAVFVKPKVLFDDKVQDLVI